MGCGVGSESIVPIFVELERRKNQLQINMNLTEKIPLVSAFV